MTAPPLVSRRRLLIAATASAPVLLLGAWSSPEAQPREKIRRLGVLAATARPAPSIAAHPYRAFLDELWALGYREEESLIVDWRQNAGRPDLRRREAAALLSRRPDVVVAASGGDALAVREVSTTVPIVVAAGGDLVGMGLASTVARPGKNVTGLQILSPELAPKRLQLLKELMPRLQQVALLHQTPGREEETAFYARLLDDLESPARRLGLRIQSFTARTEADLDAVFPDMKRAGVEAVVVAASPFMAASRQRLGELALRHRLVSMHEYAVYVAAGGLLAYGVDVSDLWRRAARYVDRILRGAPVAELPIEQPAAFSLAVNLRTAKALGLTIPSSLRLRADHVIE